MQPHGESSDGLIFSPVDDELANADDVSLSATASTAEADTPEGNFWLENHGDEKICVAVLDGPVDVFHPCFGGAQLEVLQDDENLEPSDHGTHTASLIFGQPGTQVRGVSPQCRGLLIPVFRSAEPGAPPGCSQQQLAAAIRRAVDEGAHVINISGGRIAPTGQADGELADAVRLCERRKVLIVAAAGNEGCRCLHVPAALTPVLAVGALNRQGEPEEHSNWGDAYRNTGVVAPGNSIVGATLQNGIAPRDGTSCATALVSGIAALLVSHQQRHGLKPDPLRVRQAILESADPCDPRLGGDCRRALAGTVNGYAAQQQIWTGREVTRVTPASDHDEVNMNGEVNMNETMDSGVEDRRTEHVPATQVVEPSAIPAGQPLTADVGASNNVGPSTVSGQGHAQPGGAGMREVMESGVADNGREESRVEASSGSCGCNEDPSQVSASHRPWTGACSCGGSQLVFFIGELGLNFSRTVRLDSFAQNMKGSPHDTNDVLAHLKDNPWAASSIVWTVGYESIPVYAVAPSGSFGETGYAKLRQLLDLQTNKSVERISFPGLISGTAQLLCGPRIPVLVPDLRGIEVWDSKEIGDKSRNTKNFLDRVFYELRSNGQDADDRAINFAATDAMITHDVFTHALKAGLELETIRVEKSPICRPGSTCRDVLLTFFDPKNRTEQARRVYRLSVDVSDTVPSRIGELRSWHTY